MPFSWELTSSMSLVAGVGSTNLVLGETMMGSPKLDAVVLEDWGAAQTGRLTELTAIKTPSERIAE
ncbi:hypothetical protein AM10699_25420 [Acaryochloris marina MBIC10699]|nr:hypothetical protein AM10699_25420 [Acaryochloris marina MBIC10699]